LVFWVDVDLTYQSSRGLAPGEQYVRLARAAPFFALAPALAVSAFRNRRASRASKWLAGGILAVYLLTPEVW
jgi:hypothetical protein